jgi:ABC-type uncharacterized transport system substrate-binding protein
VVHPREWLTTAREFKAVALPAFRACALSLGCAIGLTVSASAHPHIWIDYSTTIICHDAAITGVRIAWTFDEMYSASLFRDYTSRPSGPLTPSDVAALNKEAFQNSAEEHYFTELVVDGKSVPVTQITDFDASYDGRKMTYRFTVQLHLSLGREEHALDVDSFDREFYIDFELATHDPVLVLGAPPMGLSCEQASSLRHTTIFGPLTTRIARCRYEPSSLAE